MKTLNLANIKVTLVFFFFERLLQYFATSVPLWLGFEHPLPPPPPHLLTAIASCKIIDHQPAIICNPNRLDALWHLLKPQTLFAGFSFPPFALFLQTDKCLDLGLIMSRNFALARLCLCWLRRGRAADGRLELITLNGENIIWPHWFGTRCWTLPLRNQHRRQALEAAWGGRTDLELESLFFFSVFFFAALTIPG